MSSITSPNKERAIQPQPIVSAWTDSTNWGVFGTRRRIEVLVDENGKLSSLNLVSQSFLGRLLDWISKPFGRKEGAGRQIAHLDSEPRIKEVWDLALTQLQPSDCVNILLNNLEPAIKKTPADIALLFIKTLNLRLEAEDFKNKLEDKDIDESVHSVWDDFLQREFSVKGKDLSDLEKEIHAKQQIILTHFKDIDAVDARLHDDNTQTEIPPLQVRLIKLPNPPSPTTRESIEVSYQELWEKLRQQIVQPHSIEDIEAQHVAFMKTESLEKALFQILRTPGLQLGEGIETYLKIAKDKIAGIFQQLSPKIRLPQSPSLQQIEENQKSIKDALSKNKDLQHAKKLEELDTYIQCLKFLQEMADKGMNDLQNAGKEFGRHLAFFVKEVENEWNDFIKEKSNLRDIFQGCLKKEVPQKQAEIVEKCRRICLQDMPSPKARNSQLKKNLEGIPLTGHSSNLEFLVKEHLILSEALQTKIQNTSSIAELDYAYGQILDIEDIDKALIAIWQKHGTEGLTSCIFAARTKAVEALQRLAPGFQSPKAITLALVEQQRDFLTLGRAKMSDEEAEALDNLSSYAECWHLFQKIALDSWTQHLPSSLASKQRETAESFLKSLEKGKQDIIHEASSLQEAVAIIKTIDTTIEKFVHIPQYYLTNTTYDSLPVACIRQLTANLQAYIPKDDNGQVKIDKLSIAQIQQRKKKETDERLFSMNIKGLETIISSMVNELDVRLSEATSRIQSIKPKQIAQFLSSKFAEPNPPGWLETTPLADIIEWSRMMEKRLASLPSVETALQKAQSIWPEDEEIDTMDMLQYLEQIPQTDLVRQFCIDEIVDTATQNIKQSAKLWELLILELSKLHPKSDAEKTQIQELANLAKNKSQIIKSTRDQFQNKQKLTSGILVSNLTQLEEIVNDLSYLGKLSEIEELPNAEGLCTLLKHKPMLLNLKKAQDLDELLNIFQKFANSEKLETNNSKEKTNESREKLVEHLKTMHDQLFRIIEESLDSKHNLNTHKPAQTIIDDAKTLAAMEASLEKLLEMPS